MMRLEEKSPLAFADDSSVHNSTILGVPILVAVLLSSWEEAGMVTLATNDDGDLGLGRESHFPACFEDGYIFNPQYKLVLTFRDTIAINQDLVGERIVLLLPQLEAFGNQASQLPDHLHSTLLNGQACGP